MSYLNFKLSDDFVSRYADMEPDWGTDIGGGNNLSELIFVSKYSRKKEDGSKEKWYEVCRRCVEGMYSILKDHCQYNRTSWNHAKAQRSAEDAFDRMFNFKWTPPGRGLWMMGVPLVHEERNSAPLFNCFSGSQSLVTSNGVRKFDDFEDGAIVETWSPTLCRWVKGTKKSFGQQMVNSVTFRPKTAGGKRSTARQVVQVTPSHRWILSDGSSTVSLREGDVVMGSAPKVDTLSKEYLMGRVHGVIFGDGTLHWDKTPNRFKIQCCGPRAADLQDIAESHPGYVSTIKHSYREEAVVTLVSDIDLKSLPSSNMSSEYVAGFIDGYILADGYFESNAVTLSSRSPEALKYVASNAVLAGLTHVGGRRPYVDHTSFSSKARYDIRLRTVQTDWVVESIIPLEVKDVYCLTVDESGDFTLSGSIATGNCAAISTADLSTSSVYEAILPFVRLMEMSAYGIGVGFDTRGAGKLTIHTPLDSEETFVVPDSREGWAESVGKLLESYFFKSRPRLVFDYSLVRPAGSPLRRFGGTASGPGPLIKLHASIEAQFAGREGEKITSRDIVDIMNKIGKAIQAGGARRSAELALGSHDDLDYINLKNWELPENSERTGADGWAWNSNNSVYADASDDLSHIIPAIAVNGEPGIIFLDNMQKYGRLRDELNMKDARANLVNPCAEISLESHELCNLAELYPTRHESVADLIKTMKHAYMFTKAVTLLPTPWAETNEVVGRNRRIGISMTGIAEFVETRGWSMMEKWMNASYHYLIELDETYSEWLGIRESIKVSTVKPSGTTSLIASTTPGVHWPTTSGYFIRRVRYAIFDPMVNVLRDAGYEVEPDVNDPENTLVVSFPSHGVEVRSERDVSIWEKAHLAVMAQRSWADNMVSVTVSFTKDEANQIAPLLNALSGQLKSISFLPIDDSGTTYAQAPFEPISEEAFNVMTANIKPLGEFYSSGIEAQGEKFCANDSCDLPFAKD